MDLEMVGRGTIARCIEGLLPAASESIRKNPTIQFPKCWENEIVSMVEGKHGKQKISVTFECETLKSEKAAEEHIKKFLPNLVGLDAVVNVGPMTVSGLDFNEDTSDDNDKHN